MSDFDFDTFFNTDVTGATPDKRIPVPEGDYTARIDSLSGASGEKDGRPWQRMSITWEVEDEYVRDSLGRDKVTVIQDIFLDLTDDGALDNDGDRNLKLGKVRSAVGQNDPHTPWAPNMLLGQMARISVKHRITDEGDIYDGVSKVYPLA